MTEKDSEIEQLRDEVQRLRQEVSRLAPALTTLLKMRGFHIYKKKPMELPLLPDDRHIEQYYELLKHYAFRLFLRDVIKNQDGFSVDDVARFASRQITDNYIDSIYRMGLIENMNGSYWLRPGQIRSFGPTLEWFVAEMLQREYRTEAMWGLRFRRANIGGDYDVIAKLGAGILYIEVKSSPPKQTYQTEISAFCNRFDDLSPEIAIFFMDTELRMKDKIVPMFEEELRNRGLNNDVVRMERELFHISNRIFIINAKGGIEGNIEKAIRWHFVYNR